MSDETRDLVERLRRCDVDSCGNDKGARCIVRRECAERNEAADEIERLEAEVARLRALDGPVGPFNSPEHAMRWIREHGPDLGAPEGEPDGEPPECPVYEAQDEMGAP